MRSCRVFLDVTDIAVTSPFGNRIHPITGYSRMHKGVDVVPADRHIPLVTAHTGGVVIYAGMDTTEGINVSIQPSPGIVMRYFHLADRRVTRGAVVKTGDVIGTMGSTGASTGAHLHFQVEVNGTAINPEPYLFCDYEEDENMTQEQFHKLYMAEMDALAKLAAPTDHESREAQQWAVANQLIRGRPEGMAWKAMPTRNELAILLHRFADLLDSKGR